MQFIRWWFSSTYEIKDSFKAENAFDSLTTIALTSNKVPGQSRHAGNIQRMNESTSVHLFHCKGTLWLYMATLGCRKLTSPAVRHTSTKSSRLWVQILSVRKVALHKLFINTGLWDTAISLKDSSEASSGPFWLPIKINSISLLRRFFVFGNSGKD